MSRTEGSGTKARRQAIRRLVVAGKIRTQNELAEKLLDEGFRATQAPISRDIRELGLIKVSDIDGRAYYTLPETHDRLQANDQLKILYRSAVRKTEQAMNLVVIHTAVGLAQGVCAMIDRLGWDGVVGTLAGDDTIFIATTGEEAATRVMEVLRGI